MILEIKYNIIDGIIHPESYKNLGDWYGIGHLINSYSTHNGNQEFSKQIISHCDYIDCYNHKFYIGKHICIAHMNYIYNTKSHGCLVDMKLFDLMLLSSPRLYPHLFQFIKEINRDYKLSEILT